MSKRSLKLQMYIVKAPITTKDVCICRLLKCLRCLFNIQCMSSLILHLSILLANLCSRQHLYASFCLLTHLSLASFLWDIGKQCRPRSDTAERGVLSGSSLFAYRMFYQNFNKNENYHPTSLKTEMDLSNS